MEKRLIVNADDYGHTAGISEGIRQAHRSGIVTSTSVMMNRPDAVNAIRIAQKDCPRLGLGVHLVLTTGKPLLPADQVSSLVDSTGFFYKVHAFSERINTINLAEVYKEWRAQFTAFITAVGDSPDHLDSHHHLSYFTPGLFELMLTLAREVGCAIRVPYGVGETIFEQNDTLPALEQSIPPHAQVFFGDFYDKGATLESLKAMVQTIIDDKQHYSFEIMCHPAVVDEEVRQTSVYNDRRADELRLLQSEEVIALLQKKNIRLIAYSELRKKRVL
jgi:chitin disaccharide deacetylase